MSKEERIAIVPGSFDPITNGHLSIILKAAEEYDKVFVAVMINDQKKYMFTLEERKKIAQACLSEIEKVTVISSDGWLWELAKQLKACAIIKGVRNNVDLDYETKMAKFNAEHYPEAQTILLPAEDGLENLSSTAVRELINSKNSIEEYVPIKAIEVINTINKKSR